MSIFSLSMSPLTRQFYAGKVRVKDGYSESVGVRHDVTNDFYGCLIQLAESHGGTFTINQNGKPAFEVTVRADKGNAPAEAAKNANNDLLTYVLQDDVHNRLTPRVIDIAYTAFMCAKQPNEEDGGASDWFTDTRPVVLRAIEQLRNELAKDQA